jgi:hypothetical protein
MPIVTLTAFQNVEAVAFDSGMVGPCAAWSSTSVNGTLAGNAFDAVGGVASIVGLLVNSGVIPRALINEVLVSYAWSMTLSGGVPGGSLIAFTSTMGGLSVISGSNSCVSGSTVTGTGTSHAVAAEGVRTEDLFLAPIGWMVTQSAAETAPRSLSVTVTVSVQVDYTEIPVTMDPVTGSTDGGDLVTFTGDALYPFTSSTRVVWDGSFIVPTILSETSMEITTPAHINGVVTVGVFDFADGTYTEIAGGYTYSELLSTRPTIVSVTPNVGPMAGNTSVTIVGTHFTPGMTITFGGVPATSVTYVDSTHYTCTTPAHAAGVVDIQMTET